jgi:hypothetical protein
MVFIIVVGALLLGTLAFASFFAVRIEGEPLEAKERVNASALVPMEDGKENASVENNAAVESGRFIRKPRGAAKVCGCFEAAFVKAKAPRLYKVLALKFTNSRWSRPGPQDDNISGGIQRL